MRKTMSRRRVGQSDIERGNRQIAFQDKSRRRRRFLQLCGRNQKTVGIERVGLSQKCRRHRGRAARNLYFDTRPHRRILLGSKSYGLGLQNFQKQMSVHFAKQAQRPAVGLCRGHRSRFLL